VVVAVGACAATMGIFKGGYAMTGPIDAIVPVRWYILGCPPRPHAILHALAEAFELDGGRLPALPAPPPGFRGDPHVDPQKCMGCGACAHLCPADAIEILDQGGERIVRFNRRDCIFCATCQDVCPSQAVELAQREKSWFSDKDASRSEARLPVARCLACGAPYVPAEQVAWAMRKLDEALPMDDTIRARVRRSARICPACRRNSFGEIREAKAILAALAKNA
jgi:ferredoxin